MTVLHLQSTTGPDGTVHLGDVPLGVPDAKVHVTFSIEEQLSDEQWRKEMRKSSIPWATSTWNPIPATPCAIPGAKSEVSS